LHSSTFEDLIGNKYFIDFIKYYYSNSKLLNTVQCLLLKVGVLLVYVPS